MRILLLTLPLTLAACAPAEVARSPVSPITVAAPPPTVAMAKPRFVYPAARREVTTDTLFGVAVADPYRWLEDAGADEVKAWVAAEDGLARAHLAQLPGREALVARLKALAYVDSISAPRHFGKRWFYTRTHADKEKAIVYCREGEAGREQVLLDPNTMSPDGTTSIGVWTPSWDGERLAYTLKLNNSDEATLYVLDVATLATRPRDTIPGAKYAQPSWTPKSDGFYYTRLPVDPAIPAAERPGFAEIYFHRLGEEWKRDRLIHPRTADATSFLSPELSRDGRWLFVYLQHGWRSTDVYLRDLHARGKAAERFRPFVVGLDAQFQIEAWRDRFYVFTNLEAPRWRVLRADPKQPAREHWREIVPADQEAVLSRAEVVGEHLALTWLQRATSRIELRTLDGKPVREVPLPGVGSSSGLLGQADEDDAYFTFTSFTRPLEIYRSSIKSGATTQWAKVTLPIDPTPYEVEQLFYPSRDGTKISMFVVRRRDMPKDGSTPFLLAGYGGFNISMLPAFRGDLYPWLEAGGGFALPNLRGGGEYGEEWHRAGMEAKKQNVFDDFTAAADFLVASGYTKPERLAIRGGSNGGLLVGAALTQQPAKFRAVICAVPLLDMVRYHRFGSGKTWVSEYGSAETEPAFKALFAYSPYHHVAPAPYPAVLIASADSDDRVDPLHARKMAAALQAAQQGDRPILLRVERNAGHGGADLVKQTVELSADGYAFLMQELGMTPRRARP